MEAGADREKAIAAAETDAASRRVAESPRIYDLFPPLLGPAPNWTRHLPRIAAMGFNWVHVGAAAPVDDEAPLRGFIQAAGQHGL